MRKFTRAVAAVITVLMVLSLMSVMTFAATKVFATDYVDPTGTVLNSAYFVSPSLRGYKQGTQYTTEWDGENYVFIYGYNAFANIADAVAHADGDARVDRIQLLLGAGSFGEVTIAQSMDVFGINWNTNPNYVNPEDPTLPWTLNPVWEARSSRVTNVVITAGANEEVNVMGLTVNGRLYDNFRGISAAKTVVRFKNINLDQTPEGLADFKARLNYYAISLWNPNAANTAVNARQNIDETYFINFRLTGLAAPCTRLFDENISPKLFFQGCFFDHGCSNFTSVAAWFKWKDNMTDCNLTFDGCFFYNFNKTEMDWQFESFEKKAVGVGGEDQYTQLNIVNNVFYNAMGSGVPVIRYYPAGFSEVHIDDNIVINTESTSNTVFMGLPGSNGYGAFNADFTDRITMRNNTLIGMAGLTVNEGNSQSKIDVTGTYILPMYTEGWRTSSSEVLPAGKVRYDYCYFDAARTRRTTDIPDFKVNGVAPDKDGMTLAFTVPAATQTLELTTEGIDYFELYESDKDFSNYEDFSKSAKLDTCEVKDNNNYYLFLGYSLDHNNYDVYKLTVTKEETAIGSIELVNYTPEDADVESEELHVNVRINRDKDEFSFMLSDATLSPTSYTSSTGSMTYAQRLFTVKNIPIGETAVVHLLLSKRGITEHYYIYIDRALSGACELISVDDAITVDGSKLSVTLGADDTEFTFTPVVSDGAKAYVILGTTTFPTAADGSVTITDIGTGASTYKLVVIAENGENYNSYELTVNKPLSDEAELISIRGATKNDKGFSVTVSGNYTVTATVSEGATYQVYSDAAATKPVKDNALNVTANMTVYVVVTSESGNAKSAPVALNITLGEQIGGSTPATPTVKFTDVTAGAFYEAAVNWAVANGVTSGTSATTFSPSQNCTRGQVVTFLWRAAGSPEPASTNNPFTDVASSAYYYKAVLWAVEKNVTNGLTATTFGPNATCNRGQVVTFLWRAKGSPKASATTTAFTDVKADGFYYGAMLWAVENKVTNGMTATTFGPAATCTRGQVVTFLQRAFG